MKRMFTIVGLLSVCVLFKVPTASAYSKTTSDYIRGLKLLLGGNLSLALELTEKAEKEKDRRFPNEPSTNDRGNAFKHAYWSALLASYLGESTAKKITDDHENTWFKENPANEKAMDLHNNAVGIRIGAATAKAAEFEIAKLVVKALDNGEMLIIRNGVTLRSNTPTNAKGPTPSFVLSAGNKTATQGQTLELTVKKGESVSVILRSTSKQPAPGTLNVPEFFSNNVSIGTGTSITWKFNAPKNGKGTHPIKMTITNNWGFSTTATATIIVTEVASPPTAAFAVNGKTATNNSTITLTSNKGQPVKVTLDASSSKAGTGSLTYQWDIGGKNISSAKSLTTSFTKGKNPVKLTVKDSSGQTATLSITVDVK